MVRRLFRAIVAGVLLALMASFLFGCGSDENPAEENHAETPEEHRVADQSKPNIVFILIDDLDARLLQDHLVNYPNLQQLAANGTTFENAFVTNPVCCPSRATILRGQYSHNHGTLTNDPPQGGFERFKALGREESTIATWLLSEGYLTVLIGKYLNGDPPGYDPPGWVKSSGPGGAYGTDGLAAKAAEFIRRTKGKRRPFFMYLATRWPHWPADPAPRHADAFPDAKAPAPPSFNEEDVSDKPTWVRERASLTSREIKGLDEFYRRRLQSMLAVDDLIERVVESLKYSGKLSNSYIVFTSDNGLLLGEHRMSNAKDLAYEESIRVPLIVRGPGVPEGQTLEHLVLNNDFAPTFADLGGVSPPPFVDGRSLVPLLSADPPSFTNWRSAILVENYQWEAYEYRAIRTRDRLWVEYKSGERELYDLREDPYELTSLHETAPDDLKEGLSSRLDELRNCSREGCRAAEGF
jgi:N-acetylglucosamine-6-sulfatase